MKELRILRDIGFTEGEIKVYKALIELQKSTITRIIDRSGVSSSKVYLILDKLVDKGLANYIMKDNIKEFQLADPSNIIEYIQKEKARIEEAEKEAVQLVSQIRKRIGAHEEESAHIYRGLQGVKTAHMNLVNEMKKGEEYVFFSVDKEAMRQEAVRRMFRDIHKLKDSRGIRAKGIADPSLKEIFKKHMPSREDYQIKYHTLTTNQGVTVGKTRVIIENTHPDPMAIEIISRKTAENYRRFFYKIWKSASK